MCAHVYRRYATDIMHQAALAPARRLWFRIWIAMAMRGAVRQCDGLPAGDRTYRHTRRVAVPALLVSGGWYGRPRTRGVVAICMAFGTAARGRRRRSWWRTPACAPGPGPAMRVRVGAYVTPVPRRCYPCGLGLRPFTATL